MQAWLEPIAAVIRVGADGAGHGDAYHFAATVRFMAIDQVEVLGVDRAIAKADWRAMIECFRLSGIKKVFFTRIKNGVSRTKCLVIKG
jgi:hypothetical protein